MKIFLLIAFALLIFTVQSRLPSPAASIRRGDYFGQTEPIELDRSYQVNPNAASDTATPSPEGPNESGVYAVNGHRDY